MKQDIVALNSKGQLTLPPHVRKDLNLQKSRKLLIIRTDHSILIRPLTRLSSLFEIVKQPLHKTDIDRKLKEIRLSWNKEFKRRLTQDENDLGAKPLLKSSKARENMTIKTYNLLFQIIFSAQEHPDQARATRK